FVGALIASRRPENSHPILFSGRREAIRAPTKENARRPTMTATSPARDPVDPVEGGGPIAQSVTRPANRAISTANTPQARRSPALVTARAPRTWPSRRPSLGPRQGGRWEAIPRARSLARGPR